MLLLSLMASSHSGCPFGLVLHQEQPISRPLKNFPHLLAASKSRQELIRSSILSFTANEQDDLFNSMSWLYGYNKLVGAAPIIGMPLLGDMQDEQADYLIFSSHVDKQWSKHRKLSRLIISRSNGLEKDCLESMFPDMMGIPATAAHMQLLHLASTDFESNIYSGPDASLVRSMGNYYDLEANCDLVHDLPSPTASDGRLPFVGSMIDMKDFVSVLEEFKLPKDSTWRKQVLVPNFRWSDTITLPGETYLSSLKVDSLIAVPIKSPQKVKRKQSSKRKSKKVGDRNPYKNNSLQACEMLLSLLMDKKRNQKSVRNALKKAGLALPSLLTQFSASITGTGLAVMFSVIYKVACGSIPCCTSNLLTSGFGIGLFWLSWAVNKLRDTVIEIGKNSSKLEFEEGMMAKVEKSVNDILFRCCALMVVLVLRFA